MPRYYFNICDDAGAIPDTEGMILKDIPAAVREAEASARELLINDIRAHREVDHRRVEVEDSKGAVVATYRLRDLIH